MLEAQHLSKTFFPPRADPVRAVDDVCFQVNRGEIFGLLGPNGAGKTTLLRMLAGIIPPTSGRCLVDGVPGEEDPDNLRRQIGFLSGNTRLYRRLNGRELLAFFGRLYEMKTDAIQQRTEELIRLLEMASFIDRRCESLSTGQTQRVSIARVLLHQPPVLILDEPTLGLDVMTSRTIMEFILEAKQEGHCILFSTHYMSEAERLCDHVALMHTGRIMARGTMDSLYAQTNTTNLQDAFLATVDHQETGTER